MMTGRQLAERLLALPDPDTEVFLEHDSTDIAFECLGAEQTLDAEPFIILTPGAVIIDDYEMPEDD